MHCVSVRITPKAKKAESGAVLLPLAGGSAAPTQAAAAPSHAPEQREGFLFRRCRFTAEEGVAPASIWLARPWRDYGLAVFEDCVYGPHIHPLGFDKWNDTHRDETARFFERPPVPGRQVWINRPAP